MGGGGGVDSWNTFLTVLPSLKMYPFPLSYQHHCRRGTRSPFIGMDGAHMSALSVADVFCE